MNVAGNAESDVISLNLDQSTLSSIYSHRSTQVAIEEIENSVRVMDSRDELSLLVNTSLSKSESISRWFKYREAYSPLIIRTILNKYPSEPDSFVFDPMCGSGSTQIGAQRLGLKSCGIDVSPYAVLISSVKTSTYSRSDLKTVCSLLTEVTRRTRRKVLPKGDYALQRYFPDENLKTLVGFRDRLLSEPESKGRRLLFAAILSIVEECSNRKKDGNGLVTRASRVTDPRLFLEQRVHEILEDISERGYQVPSSLSLEFSAMNCSKAISFAKQTLGQRIGTVIFSPPYANSFDYFESYKLELLFGKFFDVNTLRLAKKRLIRSYRQGSRFSSTFQHEALEMVIGEILNRIPEKEGRTGVRDGRSRLLPFMLRGYFEDMATVLKQLRTEIEIDQKVHIVVDQSSYLGVLVPTDLLLGDVARNCGFEFNDLMICREARTSTQQSGRNSQVDKVLRESVVTLVAS